MLKTSLDFEEPMKIGNDDDSMIWAHIDLQQTLAGRLLTALTKAPIVNLEATFRDGRVRQYRILPAAAAAGFLLSPVVENRFDFLALQRPEIRAYLSNNRIKTIRLLPQPSIIPAYRNRVPVTLERLRLKVAIPSPPQCHSEVRNPSDERIAIADAFIALGVHQDGSCRDPDCR
jgi:hypothetical protein